MCGPLEYAQPPYFYLLAVGVVTTNILSNRKASAQGSSTDSIDDNDDILNLIIYPFYIKCKTSSCSVYLCHLIYIIILYSLQYVCMYGIHFAGETVVIFAGLQNVHHFSSAKLTKMMIQLFAFEDCSLVSSHIVSSLHSMLGLACHF